MASYINNQTITGDASTQQSVAVSLGDPSGYPASALNVGSTYSGFTNGPSGFIQNAAVDGGGVATSGTLTADITNQGTIVVSGTGGVDGIFVAGTLTGTIDNSGTIARIDGSSGDAIGIGAGPAMPGSLIGSVVNSGVVENAGLGYAVNFSAAQHDETLTNTGSIIGSIALSPNADVVNIDGGTIFGNILAGAAGHGMIDVAVGSGNVFNALGELGDPQGSALAAVNVVSGTLALSDWGINAQAVNVATGATLVGPGTSFHGTLTNDGVFEAAAGTSLLAGPVGGSGHFAIDSGATLELGSAAAGNVVFTGPDGVLKLDAPQSFTGSVVGFSTGDTIDLSGIAANSVSLSSGNQLTVTNSGATVATVHLVGDFSPAAFQVQADGSGGTAITVGLPAAAPVSVATALSTPAGVPAAISDTAAAVQAHLDALQGLAASGSLGSITMTDTALPNLSVSTAQLTTDAAVLADITSNFTLSVDASAPNLTILAPAGHATTAVFSGAADQYAVASIPNSDSFLVTETGTGRASADLLTNVTALQFSNGTEIVATTAPPAGGSVSSAMVTELYGAAFGRTPDAAGLNFYETYAAAHPGTPFVQFATWFLTSPEYTGNPEHNYSDDAAGDAQFISDSYNNLLHRAPEAGATGWYQTHVIDPMLAGLAPGSAALAQAETAAHAQVLAYFSQSPEFLSDVTVTAQHPADAHHWLMLV